MSQPVSDFSTASVRPPSSSSVGSSYEADHGDAAAYGALQPLTDSVDTNADRLMNELFEDIERMLDRGVSLPVEAPSSEPRAIQTSAPQTTSPSFDLALPPKLSPRQLTLGELSSESSLTNEPGQPADSPHPNSTFDLILLFVGCISVAATGILLWLLLQRYGGQFPLIGAAHLPHSSGATAPTESDQPPQTKAFLDYVKRSLDRLDRVKETNQQATALSQGGKATNPAPTVLERVYVPIYQPPQIVTTTPMTSPPTTAAPNAMRPNAPTASANRAVAPSASNVPNIAATTTYVLIGVMELGDRSAALFEVNGTPRRVQVGESIGSSGWTLVSISNQEAVVRRNGEVRSIYVGQQF